MAKREKIIILLMIVAILFGAYNFFLSAPPEPTEDDSGMSIEALNSFVVGAARDLFGDKTSDSDAYILDQAQTAWRTNPFYLSGQNLSAQRAARKVEEDPRRAVRLAYTGYIEVAHKRLAIINDLEYETGESLSQPGYFVKSITPKRVVLGVEGENENLILPLEEQSFNLR
jgi:hypothetical protein